MSVTRNKTIRSSNGQGVASFTGSLQTLFVGLGRINLIDCDARRIEAEGGGLDIIEFTCLYRPGGAATYSAAAVVYDSALGTTFDQQVEAFFTGLNAARVWPRAHFDLTPRAVRSVRPAALIIYEITEASGANSFAVGSMSWADSRGYIVTAGEAIAIGATGSVSFHSPSGRQRTATAINKGPVAIADGDRCYAIYDFVSQGLYVYQTC